MKILTAAIISEGLLLVLSAVLIGLLDLKVSWNAAPTVLFVGLLATVPLLILNFLLWGYRDLFPDTIYSRFSRDIVIPLCQAITVPNAVVIAVLSGVCEELFFRGALNEVVLRLSGPVLACLTTSLAFAAVHFIGSFRLYGGMIPLYTLVGAYFWIVHRYTSSLAGVALLHGVYNFIVILCVKTLAPSNKAT